MADVDSTLRLWNAVASNNKPLGTALIGANLDDNIRQIQAVVRQFFASPGTDMPSASTVDLSTADGFYINITGTTTITSFGTEGSGIQYLLKFAGSLTLTHNATSLILPAATNILTGAGDTCLMMSEGGGNWRCVWYQRASGSFLPAGMVMPFAGSSAPGGWLLCDGSAVSRSTYSVLFGVIGTTYGVGDGSTTFNVPDMRGRAPFGKDDMGGSAASRITSGVSGITGSSLGAVGGDQHSQQHTHTENSHSHNINSGIGVHGLVFNGLSNRDFTNGTATDLNVTATDSATATINNSGSGSSENMPPAMILLYIIKT